MSLDNDEHIEMDDGDVLTAKQVKELQKRNAQLEEEKLILKKAIAIFTPHSNND
jgi:transposase